MPVFLEAWLAGAMRRDTLITNISAGIVVGVVALPLAMAFAIASGTTPQAGLYTALVAGLIVTLMGGSRVQIAGPTGAFAVILFGVTARYGIAGLQVVTLLAGLLLVVLGLARLGGVIRFIPESVILGFTAGIAVVIWVGQWQNFFGLPAVEGETLLQRLPALLAHLPQLHIPTMLLGLASLVIMIAWPKVPRIGKLPAPLVVLVLSTIGMAILKPQGVATIGTAFGGIPRGLPPITLPNLSLETVSELIRPAFTVALLGAIESLLSATVADGMLGTKHNPNQELVGQGLANIGASLLGGFAATGAVARTATNVRHGGTNPIAGIVHGAVILLFLLVLAPLAAYIPLTSLAAILFVVAFNMSQIGRVIRIAQKAPRSDASIMVLTMVLAIFADIALAVEVGVILSLLNFFRQTVASMGVRTLDKQEIQQRTQTSTSTMVPDGVMVYTIDGPFFFGAIEQFEGALAHTDTDPRAVIIKFAQVPFVDLTGLVALKDAVESFTERGVEVALCSATSAVAKRLDKASIHGSVPVSPACSLDEALSAVTERLATLHHTD